MPGKDPLESLREDAQIPLRLPFELSFLAGIPRIALAIRGLVRDHFEPHATFKEGDPDHNAEVFKRIVELAEPLIKREQELDRKKKAEAKRLAKELSKKLTLNRILQNEEREDQQ